MTCVAITEHCFSIENFDHLFEAGDFGVDHVVGEEHGERLVADQFARHEDGVAEAQRFFLADVGYVNHVGDGADDLQQVELFRDLRAFVRVRS